MNCDKCGGIGKVEPEHVFNDGTWFVQPGFIKKCDSCDGTGIMTEKRRLEIAYSKLNESVCQSLGKALGYPWYKDDQKNFPGSTEADGVCVGEHVAESIADEAAQYIETLRKRLREYEKSVVSMYDE